MRLLILFILLVPTLAFAQTDQVSQALKSGNTVELCKFLGDDVSITLLDREDIYSKVQAEMILKDFFQKYPPSTFTSKHTGTSKFGAQFTIGMLVTSNGTFRTTCFTKKIGNSLVIQELRIERE